VKYATPAAFRTALERRLLTTARQADVPVMRLRKLVVFDRLLARLLVVAPERWLLKGALALDLRLGARSRTTKDMDLARRDDEERATADFLAAQAVDLGDYFTFVIERAAALDAALEGAAVRYHVAAGLAGRPFEDALIDVAFGGSPSTIPELLRGSDALGFAGIDPIIVPALPLAQHIAEKVHAYTRTYTGGRASSRVKDLIDIVLMRSAATFEAGHLRQALAATFLHRDTHPLPITLPTPPADWGPAYRRMAREVGLDPDVRTGFALAAAFLDPLLAAIVSDRARWEPLNGVWEEPE
jgi:hypothetical protein